jgi:hypothetical protein
VPKKLGSTRAAVEARLEEVEELLDAGVPSASVERTIAKKYSVSRRQVRNYIHTVDKRSALVLQQDAPFIRARLLRKTQRAYARCMADKEHSAGIQALSLEAKLSGAHRSANPVVLERLQLLGPPPTDKKRIVAWTQELLAIALYDAATNPSIEPIRRFQLVADLGAKIGLLQDKAEIERELLRLAEKAAVIDGEVVSRAEEKPPGAARSD